jgi:urease accessory protein
MTQQAQLILNLLQLASPTLPLGAYSYSDGLETLVERSIINSANSLESWLIQELKYGAIRIEAGVILRSYRCANNNDISGLNYWNSWLSAAKETLEIRQQSWQMGNSLIRLLLNLERLPKEINLKHYAETIGNNCNYAIAFGIAAACWQIDEENTLLGYLYSWANNLISAGIKLIPLGQTTGQQLLLQINQKIASIYREILVLEDDDLVSCSWGLSLASMAHEIQYTRLFRS